jgi:hypothetical protein
MTHPNDARGLVLNADIIAFRLACLSVYEKMDELGIESASVKFVNPGWSRNSAVRVKDLEVTAKEWDQTKSSEFRAFVNTYGVAFSIFDEYEFTPEDRKQSLERIEHFAPIMLEILKPFLKGE